MAKSPDDYIVAALMQLVEPLARALGPGTEVVVHDLRYLERSLVAIGGNVTGRRVGAPVTDLVIRQMQSGKSQELLNYRTSISDHEMESSTIFVQGSSSKPLACLCINAVVPQLSQINRAIERYLRSENAPSPDHVAPDGQNSVPETFASSVPELVEKISKRVVEDVGVPVELMRREHRLEVVKLLDKSGAFLLRDSVDYVANALGVSRYSIYSYLRELSASTDGAGARERE